MPGAIRLEKKERSLFFVNALKNAPAKCENCGCELSSSMIINERTIVAHILPKSIFKSVATEPENRWYGCSNCHHSMDNKGTEYVQAMPIFKVLQDRVKMFYSQIAASELRRVPSYFIPNKN